MLDVFWVRTVAGCSIPVTLQDMEDLRRQDVSAVLTLTEHALPPAFLHGFVSRHIPIRDFSAPRIHQLHQCVQFLDECTDQGLSPVVHCTMGRGRTGTVLAAWLIAHGTSVSDAIDEVRAVRDGAIETESQESILYDFEIDVRGTHDRNQSSGS